MARRIAPVAVALLVTLWAARAFAAAPALRVCADPDNPPFSFRTEAGNASGLYPEIASRVAERLGREARWVWLRTEWGKRAIRTGLLEGQCDLFFGVPTDGEFMGPRVRRTRPFATLSYAIVTARSAPVGGIAALRGRAVAVQFATPPQSLLAEEPGIETVTVLEPQEALEALAAGRVAAAYVWGPTASYLNAERYQNRFRILPTRGRGLDWKVGAATRASDRDLGKRLERILDDLRPEIAALLRKYHFPAEPALEVTSERESRTPEAGAAPRPLAVAARSEAALVRVADSAREDGGGAGVAALAQSGRSLFNSLCAHCHGPDGAAAQAKQDLRLLRSRYGDEARSVFLQTVQNGRPAKGMPPWGAALKADEIQAIEAFIFSIQKPGDI